MKNKLVDIVIKQIVKDVNDTNNDLTAIEELLKVVPESWLLAYLPDQEFPSIYVTVKLNIKAKDQDDIVSIIENADYSFKDEEGRILSSEIVEHQLTKRHK